MVRLLRIRFGSSSDNTLRLSKIAEGERGVRSIWFDPENRYCIVNRIGGDKNLHQSVYFAEVISEAEPADPIDTPDLEPKVRTTKTKAAG